MDVRFGGWNLRSLNRTGSMKTVVMELGKCKLDLVGVQKVGREEGSTERAEDFTFFCGGGKGDYQLGTGVFVYRCIISVVRRVEFISDRMSYIILRRSWCILLF
jgi:hypothetical protein